MDIIAGLGALNSAITTVKAVRQIEKDYDLATLKAQMVDIYGALADAKMALTDAAEENKRLTEEVVRLLKSETDISAFEEFNGYQFRTGGGGQKVGRPACPTCLDKEKRVVHLLQHGVYGDTVKCPRCQNIFTNVPYFQ